MKASTQLIQRHILLRHRRAKFDKDHDAVVRFYPDSNSLPRRFLKTAEAYTMELEHYIPNEIIDEYAYEQVFRQTLSLVDETFRPDHFDSVVTGELVHWLDFDFMEWIVTHKSELKRLLTWKQLCELQCNWMGWKLIRMFKPDFPEMTIREIWYFNDEKQKEELYEIYGK